MSQYIEIKSECEESCISTNQTKTKSSESMAKAMECVWLVILQGDGSSVERVMREIIKDSMEKKRYRERGEIKGNGVEMWQERKLLMKRLLDRSEGEKELGKLLSQLKVKGHKKSKSACSFLHSLEI